MKNRFYIFVGLLPLVLFTSCSSSKKVSDAGADTAKVIPKEVKSVKTKLDRIMVYMGAESVMKWRLTSFNTQEASELYPTNVPMMRFDEPWKQIYGTTGCNKFTAYYEKSNNSNINVSRISATEMPCNNNNESLFLDTFKSVNGIKETGNTLSLLSNGQSVMTFERF